MPELKVGQAVPPVWLIRRQAEPPVLPCAGPGPEARFFDQARSDGVEFDVAFRLAEFFRIAHPAVPGFVLPERLASEAEDLIGSSSRRAFDPSHDFRKVGFRCDQKVHVVRHDDPGMQFVKGPLGFRGYDRIGDYFGDSRIRQVAYSGSCASGSGRRNRSVQAPGEEQRSSVGLQMRQMSSVFRHSN